MFQEITAEIKIERVGLMGQGVGFDTSGNIYFVPGALPGDSVRVEFEGELKRYRDARLVEVVEKSPDREEPPCSYFHQCGGCDWMHFEYRAQLRAKEGILRHVLERGGWMPNLFQPILAATEIYGYRNRIQVRQLGKRFGFYKKRTHDIVDIDQCLVANNRLNEALTQLRTRAPSQSVKKFELCLDGEGTVSIFEDRPHAFGGFQQINSAQNQRLRDRVAEWINGVNATEILELFCGNGNLTHAFAQNTKRVIGIDNNAIAITFARMLAAPHVEFFVSQVDSRVKKKLPAPFVNHYDTLILDPPRAGIGKGLEEFIHSNVRNVLFVSCSPVEFSRDIQILKQRQFSFDEIQAIDMFPHTRHIEFVARFSRV